MKLIFGVWAGWLRSQQYCFLSLLSNRSKNDLHSALDVTTAWTLVPLHNSAAVELPGCQMLYCLAWLPAAPRGDPDLAVSFHSASLPSFTQISSSSVNSSWATCSASSSVPRMNWTRWDGVSERTWRGNERWTVFLRRLSQTHTQHYLLCQYMPTGNTHTQIYLSPSTHKCNILTSSCSW